MCEAAFPLADRTRLAASDARWVCPPEWIPADTAEDTEPSEGIIGQARALKALKLGVEMNAPGYNIFVCGLSGTGKATTIKTILEKLSVGAPPPYDYCYVYNFTDPDRPLLLRFERGQGARFRADVREAVLEVGTRIPRIYEESEFLHKRSSLMEEFNGREMELFEVFEKTIVPDGFVLGRVQEGQGVRPELLYKHEDQTMLISELDQLVQQNRVTAEQAEEILGKYKLHRAALQETVRQAVQLSREYTRMIADQERDTVSTVVDAVFLDLRENYTEPHVLEYLTALTENVLENLEHYRPQQGQQQDESLEPPGEYTVNLVLDNSATTDRPVIIEAAPTFTNIFGTIERAQDENGFWFTDFTRIKPGALLRADGGFLVLNAADALSEPYVWRAMQRVLLYRKLEIQSPEMLSQQPMTVLKPEPIDIDVKVILIGNNEIFGMLSGYERDFKKIFKVKVDFDNEMPISDETVRQYAWLVRKLATDEKLRHFDSKAIAALVEYGSRLSGSKRKVTTQFSEIADIVREADYWCGQEGKKYVSAVHIARAIEETRARHMLVEEKLRELIDDNIILIDTEGERVGQINGLAVYQGDRFSFGLPTRITAAVSAGKNGIINIEREARMSGTTHDKGMLILSGFMRETFAQERPLTLAASLSFEQSYSGVDGDSASSTEVYALLSALSGVPISQRWAVTGSVNQKGDIQPIGGVNEKIEGFFRVCHARGLTGTQGVIIPKQNVDDLMLDARVVAAVAEGRFRIHAVSRVEEGIELLTGVPAGIRKPDGRYPADTIYARVTHRLDLLSRAGMPKKKGE